MGGLAAVAKGSAEEPRLIVLRYERRRLRARPSAWSARRVTFDTGGISIKPAAEMEEMKMDMSGGAAVLEAVAAIAELGLPIDLSPRARDGEHARRARRPSPATSSPSTTARPSRSTTPTPRGA